jgi:hypothetical protein
VYTEAGRGLVDALEQEEITLSSFLLRALFRKNMLLSICAMFMWLLFLLSIRWLIERKKVSKAA